VYLEDAPWAEGKQELRVLVTGASGLLGQPLSEILREDHEVTAVDISDFDLSAVSSIPEIVKSRPETVCHLAAFTDVDRCESDPERAYQSNVVATRNVAVACRELGCPMLYVSTDYVFDGELREPYGIDARPAPLNMYGRTKLIGEWFVERHVSERCIVRSSWLFGEGGRNFVETILSASEEKKVLNVVDDQVGSPTYSKDLALALKKLVEKKAFGTYHVTNRGDCTWYDFAVTILRLAGKAECTVLRTASDALGRPARRPGYSVLDNSSYVRATGETLRKWEEALAEYLDSRTGGVSNA
jgi:dTDP-4-dehydrorhamnose reductase